MGDNKFIFRNLAKASLIGLLVVVLDLIPLEKIFGINSVAANVEAGAMPAIYLVPMFFVYGCIALVFTNIKDKLNLGERGAFIIIFAFLFIVDVLLTNTEGWFYIDDYPLAFNLIYGFLKTLLIATGIFYLWKQEDVDVDIGGEIKSYFGSRSIFSWTWRVVTVLVLSFVIYMILGAIAYPITGPFMEELIEVPSILENFTITMLRGIAYVLVTLPIIMFWKSSSKSLFLNLSLINVLLYPILGYVFAYFFPAMFRLVDGVVLSLHVISLSWLLSKLLKRGINI